MRAEHGFRVSTRLPDARLAKVLARDDFADRLAEVTAQFSAIRDDDDGWFPDPLVGDRGEVPGQAVEGLEGLGEARRDPESVLSPHRRNLPSERRRMCGGCVNAQRPNPSASASAMAHP